jgi:RNA polymerase sigma-70 factor (ECF subfamily)
MPKPEKKFSKIYDEYINKIYRFIFLKVNSQAIAEDLTSETFLRCWESFKKGEKSNPDSGNGIENIQAFLYKIARNLVIDHYREKGKAQMVPVEFEPIIDPKQDLEKKSLFDSDINQIRLALTDLKEDYQNVIIWHYLDDLPVIEVAKMMGRTEQATRVLLHRALKNLKNKLNQDWKSAPASRA